MRQLRSGRRLNWRGFVIATACYLILGAGLAGVASLRGDDVGPWVSGAIGPGLVLSLGTLFGWKGWLNRPAALGSAPRRRWWRSGFFLVFGALELYVSITQIAADSATWWAYLLLLAGLGFLAFAVHRASRAELAWPALHLEPGETVVVSQHANWVRLVSRGGTLVLTDRRLVFEPNAVERTLGLTSCSWDRAGVRTTDVAPVGWNIFGGSLTHRVRIHVNGGTELFVTRDPETLSKQLNAALNKPTTF